MDDSRIARGLEAREPAARASKYKSSTTATKTQYEKQAGKKADWFTTNGDVFPRRQGEDQAVPAHLARRLVAAFPRKELSRGINEWNHYYVRAINGEIRLWVNGEEVSGGNDADPRTGFLCLESEGSPVEFRHLRIRELP